MLAPPTTDIFTRTWKWCGFVSKFVLVRGIRVKGFRDDVDPTELAEYRASDSTKMSRLRRFGPGLAGLELEVWSLRQKGRRKEGKVRARRSLAPPIGDLSIFDLRPSTLDLQICPCHAVVYGSKAHGSPGSAIGNGRGELTYSLSFCFRLLARELKRRK